LQEAPRQTPSSSADPDQATLTRPLDGQFIEVEAADGTRIHAEAFGPDDAPTVVLAHSSEIT
jgi:hypothetical protein